jgi:hypothetical protein
VAQAGGDLLRLLHRHSETSLCLAITSSEALPERTLQQARGQPFGILDPVRTCFLAALFVRLERTVVEKTPASMPTCLQARAAARNHRQSAHEPQWYVSRSGIEGYYHRLLRCTVGSLWQGSAKEISGSFGRCVQALRPFWRESAWEGFGSWSDSLSKLPCYPDKI